MSYNPNTDFTSLFTLEEEEKKEEGFLDFGLAQKQKKPIKPKDNFNSLFGLDSKEEEPFSTLSSIDERDRKALDQISTKRKLAYGARQEPWAIGNIARLTRAAFKSALTDETFKEVSQQIEEERQQDILEDYPEFRNIQVEDAAIITGRVGSAFADPVYWLIPWTKIAQVGRAATIGTGSAVAMTDIALREKALYGEVNGGSLLLAGAIGGAATGVSDLIARRFRYTKDQDVQLSSKEKQIVADAQGKALLKPYVKKSYSFLQDAENNGALVHRLEAIRKTNVAAYTLEKQLKSPKYKKVQKSKTRLEKELEALRLKPAILTKAEKTRTLTLEEIEKLRGSPARKTRPRKLYSALEIKKRFAKKEARLLKKQSQIDKKIGELTEPIDAIDSLLIKASKLSEGKFVLTGDRSLDLKNLKKLAKESKQNLSTAYESLAVQSEHMATVAHSGLEAAHEAGGLTTNIIRRVIDESVRPLFGGSLGYGIGAAFGDEDDSSLMWSLTLAGLFAGAWQKRIQKSTFGTNHKKVAMQGLDKQVRRNLRTWLKINTAGSTAARGNAWGGANDVGSKLLVKQQGASLRGKAVTSVEEREMMALQDFHRVIYEDVFAFADEDIILAAGRLQNKFTTEGQIIREFGEAKAKKIFQVRDNVQSFTDEIGEYVSEVGIKWKPLTEHYGLTQRFDWDAVHKNPELFERQLYKAVAKQNNLNPDDLAEANVTLIQKQVAEFKKGITGLRNETVFDKRHNVIIPLTKNFEKHRQIYLQEAREEIKDFLINDPRLTLTQLVGNTVKSVEFARTFGPRGELLKSLRKQIHDKYNKIDPTGVSTTRLKQKEMNQLNNMIDGYFGMYQANQRWATGAQTTMAGMTALANSTMLTRVVIPSLGDLIQPLQNSGVYPTIKAYGKMAQKGKTFADRGLGIKYHSQMENELRALSFGVDPSNMYQHGISWFNQKFFKVVQLERITNFARARAYDIGVYRAFDIAKRATRTGKTSRAVKNELRALGLGADELKTIGKFKTAEEAYNNTLARNFLHRAGFKSAERDALIPTMGNRLLFAQSNMPLMRAVGQFLSWAQAKTTQTNALLTRIEDGDVKLAARMLLALTLYGGVRELQIAASPSDYYDKEENEFDRFSKKWIGQATVLSGNVPFQVDKLTNAFIGPGAVSPLTSMVPVVSLADKLVRTPSRVVNNAWNSDYWGAVSNTLDIAPFGKDIKNILRGGLPIQPFEIIDIKDEPNAGKSKVDPFLRVSRLAEGGRVGYAEGYEVDVPYTKDEPEERINPFTGEPYTALYYNGGRVRKGFGGKLLKKLVPTSEKDVKKNVRLFLPSEKELEAGALTKEFRGALEDTFKNPKDNIDRLTYNPNNPMYKPTVVPDIPVGQGDTSLAMEALSAVSLEQSLPYYSNLSSRKNFKQGEKVNVEEGSDDKKELNVVKEAIEKEEARLDAELQIRQSEESSNRGLDNRNFGNLYAGSFDKDKQEIIYNPKVIAYHGVTGIDSKGVGEKSPEVYAKFGKWVYGLRAMAHTLRKPKYRNKNLEEITNTYSRTDKDSYSSNVASLSGNVLKVGEPVDTHNDKELRTLMRSMLTNEVGHTMAPNELLIDEAIRLSKDSMEDSELFKTMYPKVDLTNPPQPL